MKLGPSLTGRPVAALAQILLQIRTKSIQSKAHAALLPLRHVLAFDLYRRRTRDFSEQNGFGLPWINLPVGV
jgi:hypothetical protein